MGVLEVTHEVPGFLGKRKGSARLGLTLATLTQPFRPHKHRLPTHPDCSLKSRLFLAMS